MLQTIENINSAINSFIWGVPAMICIIGVGLILSLRTGFIQIRKFAYALKMTIGRIFDNTKASDGSMTPFQAVCTALAATVGTGNIAGVAGAIAIGGPGAVFWMWVMALLGASTAFMEATLAQLFKRKGEDSFYGGPAYYMQYGLKRRWMGILFAIFIIYGFGLANQIVQSNTLCDALSNSFSIPPQSVAFVLTAFTLIIIFGGIQRIAHFSALVVPFMAIGYLILSIIILFMNLEKIPDMLELIIKSAFGWEQAAGGAVGTAIMQGVKRGLFSNEAGVGSAPNASAAA